jgi:acyl-[acyl-carrier-protein]-phospholipid O-acyltransferase/long-chain-fatty-acid--[acyl-carrier-protein] ligase
VLLPTSLAMPLTLLSLWEAGKIPAILNFSTGAATMLACAQLAGIKQIITSKLFLERARLNLKALEEAGIELIYLEDVRAKISRADRMRALRRVVFNPQSAIRSGGGVSPLNQGRDGPATLPNPQLSYGSTALPGALEASPYCTTIL